MPYPAKLAEIVDLFDSQNDEGKRDLLVDFAGTADACAPREGETFDLQDVRKDEECTDTVGVFLRVGDDGRCLLRMTLGPQVQTLTRAMAAILCKGLTGATPQEIADAPSDFVPRLTGAPLARVRSHTIYYVLGRIKGICVVHLRRQRTAVVPDDPP
jgi:cysteine desulfuration protein SufE